MKKNIVVWGKCERVVRTWPDNCIDSIVTDPPYGLEFMGKEWDKLNLNVPFSEKEKGGLGGYKHHIRFGHDTNAMQQWHYQWAKAMFRITKPGGFLLCFGSTRTFHRLACAIEDAGWEIRDCMMWLYGSGFPKSHNIGKAIDKKAGAKRKVVGKYSVPGFAKSEVEHGKQNRNKYKFEQTSTIPITDLAQLWNGYGTALKPAWEPIIVAMKPKEGSFADNAEKYGVAGLNIDGGRIQSGQEYQNTARKNSHKFGGVSTFPSEKQKPGFQPAQDRWPANLILDEEAGKMLDKQTQNIGNTKPHKVKSNKNKYEGYGSITHKSGEVVNYNEPNVRGASRFFYCAKASKKERNLGLENSSRQNTHPTVKPLALMKYLCTLVKMPNPDQIILDPFAGSFTTCIACKQLGINYIGIENHRAYYEIGKKRLEASKK